MKDNIVRIAEYIDSLSLSSTLVAVSELFIFTLGGLLSFSNDVNDVCGIDVRSDVDSVQKVEGLEESSHLCFGLGKVFMIKF